MALVLFAACSNVANLLLALRKRAPPRNPCACAAMGAVRIRLIRELLIDSTLLAAGGGMIGFLLGWLGLRQLMQFKPYIPGFCVIPLTIDFRPDMRVAAATAWLLIFLAGLATGLVPGLSSLRAQSGGSTERGDRGRRNPRKGRIRNALVVIQVAVCTVVPYRCGFVFSKREIICSMLNLGFSTRNIATVDLGSASQWLLRRAGLKYVRENARGHCANLRRGSLSPSPVTFL